MYASPFNSRNEVLLTVIFVFCREGGSLLKYLQVLRDISKNLNTTFQFSRPKETQQTNQNLLVFFWEASLLHRLEVKQVF
jgi:hypothetical protein